MLVLVKIYMRACRCLLLQLRDTKVSFVLIISDLLLLRLLFLPGFQTKGIKICIFLYTLSVYNYKSPKKNYLIFYRFFCGTSFVCLFVCSVFSHSMCMGVCVCVYVSVYLSSLFLFLSFVSVVFLSAKIHIWLYCITFAKLVLYRLKSHVK